MTPAIVSRCRIFQFYPLGEADVILAMRRALADRERGFGATAVEMDEEAMRHIARIANGDVRSALGALELAVLTTEPGEDGVIHITMEVAEESIQKAGHPLRRIAVLRHALRVLQEPARQRRGRGDGVVCGGCSTRASIRA